MPPTPRERFNAKARRSVAGGSSHKKKRVKNPKKNEGEGQEHPDANTEILVEKTKEEKEQHRREILRQELLAAQEKPSKKKQRRLEKYIDKKLRQEERVEILKRLAQTQAELPSTATLQSSATLGSGRTRTANERATQEENIAVRKAFDGRTGKKRRQRIRQSQDDSEDGDSEDVKMSDVTSSVPPNARGKDRDSPIVVHDADIRQGVIEMKLERPAVRPATSIAVGSALKHNPDGSLAMPIMSKRRSKPPKITRMETLQRWRPPKLQAKREGDSSDFDSSDSANDTDSQDGDTDEGKSGGETEGEEGPSDPEIAADSLKPPKLAPVTGKRSFKDWAKEQINATLRPATEAEDETPLTHIEAVAAFQDTLGPAAKRRRVEETPKPGAIHGPMGEKLKIPDTEFARGVLKERGSKVGVKKYVTVNRTDEVREARMMLPILAEEQNIVETVLLHPVTLVCGETGSGKTTQIPQFLFEAGYGSHGSHNPGMVGITQPRRVAAVSMAARVGQELSLPTSKVSYQIRYDATTAPTTSIKFMTDGVLLREMATDFLLSKYSVIIVDEAHERSLNTDILIGTLSRVIKIRAKLWLEGRPEVKPLRLIIMSATLRISDFAENQTLFEVPPPIIEIPARQHPVTVHFNRKTHAVYVDQAIRKTIKIHSRLPPGGILVFLTGQNEIAGVCKRLEKRFGKKAIEEKRMMRQAAADKVAKKPKVFPEDDLQEIEPNNIGGRERDIEVEEIDFGVQGDLAVDVDGSIAEEDPEALDSDTESEGQMEKELGIGLDDIEVPMHVVPLYSLLSNEKQMRVFKPPPEDARLVVVATNVAETSLTIPGIRYVVDCGRAKERRFDPGSGIQSFHVSWISKASASQRAGRAGRTGPGHCYRLYSSALYENHFDEFSIPEILRTPIEGIVLQMKSMYIDAVVNFPFPTPPDRSALKKTEATLTNLGAIEPGAVVGKGLAMGGKITELGRSMALFPVNPRFGKMLATGMQQGCMPYVIALVSALSVGDPFLHEEVLDQQGEDDEEDNIGDLELGAEFVHIKSEEIRAKEIGKAKRQAFFRSQQALAGLGDIQSDALRLLAVVGAYEYAGGGIGFCEKHFLRPKAMEEIHALRAQISSIAQANFPSIDMGFKPNIPPPKANQVKALRQLIAASFIDQVAIRKDIVQPSSANGNKYASCRGVAYRANGVAEDVFVHPSSVLFHKAPPDYVVFQEVARSTKVWIKIVTVINPAWIAPLGKVLCTFSKPIPVPLSMKDAKPGEVLVVPRYGPGWELPPIRKMKD